MKKLILLCLLLTGCSTVTVTKGDLEMSYTRLWFDQEGLTVDIDGLGRATVERTSADKDVIKALLPLLVASQKPSLADLLKTRQ